MNKQQLIVELQTHGLKLVEHEIGAAGRKGGAGPSDHKAVTVDGTTVMVPIYNNPAAQSPYTVGVDKKNNQMLLQLDREAIGSASAPSAIAPIQFPHQPKFYSLATAEGIPYSQIALLHSRDVLATTVLQTCMRYGDTENSCQFCAIGQSLAAGRTIARKTPAQLAEVAEAAVRLDGVGQMVMTTGTPNTSDRGAAYLTEWYESMKLNQASGMGAD